MKQSCWLYVMRHEYAIKVGITVDVESRRRDLERSSGLDMRLIASWEFEDRRAARTAEEWVLHDLSQWRGHGEWINERELLVMRRVHRRLRGGVPTMGPALFVELGRANGDEVAA